MTFVEVPWAEQIGFPILATLQLFPLMVGVILFYFRHHSKLFHWGIVAALIQIFLSVYLYLHYDSNLPAMQFAESFEIIGALSYHAAVDGVSVIFILLTSVLSLLVLLYGKTVPIERPRHFPPILFLVISSVVSLYSNVNLLWFALVSVIELILVGILLWRWATSPDRSIAMSRYLQFMGFSLSLFLVGVIMLGWNYADQHGGVWSYDLFQLAQTPVGKEFSSIIFFLLFYGLAIRIPLFPLHGWLPVVLEHGTIALAPVFLLGLKIGVYGLLRFVFPILPDAVLEWHEFVVAFAVAGVFYAALLALMQMNLRRLLSFAVVSHTSILTIGLFSLNPIAFQGSVMLSVNFGMATSGLMFMIGFIYWRTGTVLLSRLGGLFELLPLVGLAFLIAGLSIVGMPGTPGFDAVHLVLEASIERFGALVTIAAAIGNVIAAGFLLWSFQRAFLAQNENYMVLNRSSASEMKLEKIIAASIILMLLMSGFFSEPWLQLIEQPLNDLGALFGHEQFGHEHKPH